MNLERDLIISLLKLTRNGSVSKEIVKNDAKLPSVAFDNLLRKLQNDGLVYVHKDIVEADSFRRLELAVRTISLGIDIESVSDFLQWKEFESVTAIAFERNGYGAKRNLRFKYRGRKWEIDVVGFKKPLAVCVDCKHWHHGMSLSAVKKIVGEQVERTSSLAESLPNPRVKAEFVSWDSVKLVPAVLSLVASRFKFYDKVPIVPVLQLQDFLRQLPAYADSLKHFSKRLANKLNNRS
jgi:Holliday junction resolvase-like predicted endonuclease